ncbi:MAG TPA: hypothetical protein VMH23_17610, partial [Bacteroidota bacterium]|nr:hypothetical protein [Bacteroidota bacterium]
NHGTPTLTTGADHPYGAGMKVACALGRENRGQIVRSNTKKEPLCHRCTVRYWAEEGSRQVAPASIIMYIHSQTNGQNY